MWPTSVAKHNQIIDLKEPHCIFNVARSTQLGIPVSTVKNIWRWHQEDGYVAHCYKSGFPQSHSSGNTGLPFSWQHETDHNLRVDCANTKCGLCGSPSTQEWPHGADIMTWWLLGLSFSVDNPVFEYHRPASPICKSLPGFLSCKRPCIALEKPWNGMP